MGDDRLKRCRPDFLGVRHRAGATDSRKDHELPRAEILGSRPAQREPPLKRAPVAHFARTLAQARRRRQGPQCRLVERKARCRRRCAGRSRRGQGFGAGPGDGCAATHGTGRTSIRMAQSLSWAARSVVGAAHGWLRTAGFASSVRWLACRDRRLERRQATRLFAPGRAPKSLGEAVSLVAALGGRFKRKRSSANAIRRVRNRCGSATPDSPQWLFRELEDE